MKVAMIFKKDWDEMISNGAFSRGPLQNWKFSTYEPERVPLHISSTEFPVSDDGTPKAIAVKDGYVVSFADLARFQIHIPSETIHAFDIGAETTPADLSHFLCDHIAPRILAHLGQLILHGSAVEISGAISIFLGETGSGKSTLAASLHRAGHRLLGDDAVIITRTNDGFVAQPVYPSLRLYPDTVSAVLDDQAQVSAMAHYSTKQRVTLSSIPDLPATPLPIAALFYLSVGDDDALASVREPSPAQACISALEHSFSLDPADGKRAAERLAIASKLVENVDTFAINVPHQYNRLSEVHAMIEACLAGRETKPEEAI